MPPRCGAIACGFIISADRGILIFAKPRWPHLKPAPKEEPDVRKT
jgi:hypothetical protein